MAFASDLANLVASQLTRLVTLNRHQLAGHVANLEFWLGQVRNGLEVIDGYEDRFHRMRDGQAKYAHEHNTVEFDFSDPRDTEVAPATPRKVPDNELRDARRALIDAAQRFLKRCEKEGMLSESESRRAEQVIGLTTVRT